LGQVVLTGRSVTVIDGLFQVEISRISGFFIDRRLIGDRIRLRLRLSVAVASAHLLTVGPWGATIGGASRIGCDRRLARMGEGPRLGIRGVWTTVIGTAAIVIGLTRERIVAVGMLLLLVRDRLGSCVPSSRDTVLCPGLRTFFEISAVDSCGDPAGDRTEELTATTTLFA